VVGLETALGAILTHLVRPGILSLREAIRRMSTAPAAILGVAGGTVAPGSPADLVCIDPDRRWTVRRADLASRSRNTPFEGWTLQGRAVMTLVGGAIAYEDLSDTQWRGSSVEAAPA
jgi:dihydroorotase